MTATQKKHLLPFKVLVIIHVVVIALYFGLIGAGTWRTDEYDTLTQYRDRGLEFFVHRFTHWSPRPFSEALIFAYSTIVNATHFQLTTAALFITWAGLLGSIALPFFAFNHSIIPRHARALIITLPIAMTLALASTGEVFYWPFGAFAYMPTISALTIMFGLVFWFSPRANGILLGISSSILATASELGAFFILLFLFSSIITAVFIKKPSLSNQNPNEWLKPMAPAIALAVFVILWLTVGRFENSDEAKMGINISHNFWAALRSTIPETFRQFLTASHMQWPKGGIHILIKLGFGSFIYCIAQMFPDPHRDPKKSLAFGLACIFTLSFSLFAAYYQFGIPCCERHDTVRYFLSCLAIGAFALTASHYYPIQSIHKQWMPRICIGSLAFISMPIMATSAIKLWSDYRHYADIRTMNQLNWLFNSTSPYIFQIDVPTGRAIGNIPMPLEGVYSANDPTNPRTNDRILHFFNLKTIDFKSQQGNTPPLTSSQLPTMISESPMWRKPTCMVDQFRARETLISSSSTHGTLLHASGWINLPDAGILPAEAQVMLRITHDNPATQTYFPLKLTERPDVAEHFHQPDAILSGYSIKAEISSKRILNAEIIATNGHTTARCALNLP